MAKATDEYEGWGETDDSAVFLTDFVGTVLRSFWSSAEAQAVEAGRDAPTYDNADRTQLYWHVRVDDILDPEFERDVESVIIPISVGSGWWADEAGEVVTHEDDSETKPRKFRGDSRLGQILALIRGDKGEYKDVDHYSMDNTHPDYDMTPALKWVRDTGFKNTRNARGWEGSVWRFAGVATKTGNSDREPRVKSYPVAFLGSGDTNGGESAVAHTPSSTEPVDRAALSKTLPSDTPADVVEELARLVEAASSHTEFMRNAVALPGVKGKDDLTKAIMDEQGGPWSRK
jgi:hypothetical protein